MSGTLAPVTAAQRVFRAVAEPPLFLWRHRDLIRAMSQRDIVVPYAGQMLGAVWAIGHPLFLVALLAVVFQFVFGARFGSTRELPLDYTVFILAGLVPWQFFAQVLGTSGVEVTSNDNLVKQVVFPVEVLPIKTVVNALPTLAVGLIFLVVYVLLTSGSLPWTYALLPVVIGLHLVWMFGVALALAALGVFFRDLKDIVRLFVTAGVYVLPIIYIPGLLPPVLEPVIYVNPFSPLVWCYQDVLYFGRVEHPWAWLAMGILSVASFYGGFAVFHKLRPFFGNVL